MGTFLQEVFRRFGGGGAPQTPDAGRPLSCGGMLDQAVEHVVDQTYGPLRAVSGYYRRLQGPVALTLRYIDALGDDMPGAIECRRSAFFEDPRVNAFFVSPKHMQEVFSGSAEVRELLDGNPDATECWALLCMRKMERRQLGMSLLGDSVRKEVMQTSVSFTDHEIVTPGTSEEDARRSLKCCIVNGLLSHVRKRILDAETKEADIANRIKALRGRLQHSGTGEDAAASRSALQAQIETLEQERAELGHHLLSPEDHLEFVADLLANPARYLTSRSCSIRLSRMGVKLERDSPDDGYEVPLSEVRIASQKPRVGALVRFPRSELLPQQDFLTKADLFLAL